MNIIAYIIVGTGEADRYLPKVLERTEPLVDKIVIACNARDEKTRKLVSKYEAYDFSDYEWGKKQHIIKEKFFRKAIAPKKPDWIICLDADEILDYRITRETLEELASRGEIAYTFYCYHMWGKDKARVDGAWGEFRNVRYFKFVDTDWSFQNTPLHCGLAPVYAYKWSADAEYCFYHYGYFNEQDRSEKVKRYQKYDPQMIYRSAGYYKSILEEPTLIKPKVEKLKYNSRKPLEKKYLKNKIMEKVYYIQNKHGKVLSVKESMLKEHLKIPGNELINDTKSLEENIEESLKEIPEVKEEEKKEVKETLPKPDNELVCDVCNFQAKSKAGLLAHKRKHK